MHRREYQLSGHSSTGSVSCCSLGKTSSCQVLRALYDRPLEVLLMYLSHPFQLQEIEDKILQVLSSSEVRKLTIY